jgi:exonuclease V
MREPQGVEPAHVRRCHWCEFEDGCEWRQAKAAEALERYRAQRLS